MDRPDERRPADADTDLPDKVFEKMQSLFTEMFAGARLGGPRLVPLRVERGYRGIVAEQREVAFRRSIFCTACRAQGCRACGGVGWRVVGERVTVMIPAEAQASSRIAVPGKGDDAPSGAGRELQLELVEDDARECELESLQNWHEAKLDQTWRAQRDALRVKRKRAWLGVGAFLLLFVVAPTLLWIRNWASRARVGEPCAYDRDCQSSQCLRTRGPAAEGTDGRRFLTVTGHVCTSSCAVASDCPAAMTCGAVRTLVPVAPDGVTDEGPADGRACVPR